MKPRIQVALEFDALANAQGLRNGLIARFAGKSVFETRRLDAINMRGANWLLADSRLNVRTHRDDIRDWILQQLSLPPIASQVIKAVVIWHDCTHDDESPKSCRDETLNEFVWP